MPDYDYGYGHERSQPAPDELIKSYLQKLPVWLFIAIVLVVYLMTGIYTVGPDEQGVIKRFGKFVAVATPGLHYHLPFPVETVSTPKVTEVKRIEIGFRTIDPGAPARYSSVEDEASMLTGDENIVNIELIVQYRIKDAADYLFKVKDPDETVRSAAQAALRQVVGSQTIDNVLTTGKFAIQEETMNTLQGLLDSYEAGIVVLAVQLQDVHPPAETMDAFKDVASAKEDKVKFVNEAEGYANDIIPKARGEAEKILREAEAYNAARIALAEGEAQRFTAVLKEYRQGEEVTRTRLYLETMERILPGMEKYIMDSEGDLLKLLDLSKTAGGGAR